MVKRSVSKEREERLEKLKDPTSGRYFIISLHHGLIHGPLPGLVDMKESITKITNAGASGIILQKGILRNVYRRQKRELAVIMHLSANTTMGPDQYHTVTVGSVKEALFLGATGVSVQVNIGADSEAEMLRDLGKISTECNVLKVPLFAMMTPGGPMVDDPLNVDSVKHATRVGAELGADVVITNYTGSVDSFKEVVESCPMPVVVSGGPKMKIDLDVLKMVKNSLTAGAAGVAMGRNVFQNENIQGMAQAIAWLLKEDADVEMVYKGLMESRG
jgi:fructose-bisphosphate aldolase/2-amino-3,7-dideoxy-D-threo-hept-6-ulosonate synthase